MFGLRVSDSRDENTITKESTISTLTTDLNTLHINTYSISR